MRLPRPHIPVEVKCRVALSQLGELWIDRVIEDNRPSASNGYMTSVGVTFGLRSLSRLLGRSLDQLAELLACGRHELHLDHDPPLGAREKIFDADGVVIRYVPDANDPEHLFYRDKAGHQIKTNVRGDGAQHPDRVLIKRQRRRERGYVKRKTKIPSRPFAKINSRPFAKGKRPFRSRKAPI